MYALLIRRGALWCNLPHEAENGHSSIGHCEKKSQVSILCEDENLLMRRWWENKSLGAKRWKAEGRGS